MTPEGAERIVGRRDFLVRSGGTLAALSLGSAGCENWGIAPHDGNKPVDVIVVGAGLAGLAAAYELVRAGYDVTILEAQARAGGRAQTLREPFDDGLLAEAGPARIPPTHDRTLGYIDHFGIETSLFYPQGELDYWLVPSEASGILPYPETPEFFLNERYNNPPRGSWVKIPEGTDRLPQAFADAHALRKRIRYSSPVTKIVQEESRVVATYEAGSSTRELECDYLICTVPLPVIDKIQFEPALSAEKRAAFEALPYQDVTRVYVQYASRIWEDAGLNGFGLSQNWGSMLEEVAYGGALASDLEPGRAPGPAHVLHVRKQCPERRCYEP